jgi:hypothetical protein
MWHLWTVCANASGAAPQRVNLISIIAAHRNSSKPQLSATWWFPAELASCKAPRGRLTCHLADEDRLQAALHVGPAPGLAIGHGRVGHAAHLHACAIVGLWDVADAAPVHVRQRCRWLHALITATQQAYMWSMRELRSSHDAHGSDPCARKRSNIHPAGLSSCPAASELPVWQ